MAQGSFPATWGPLLGPFVKDGCTAAYLLFPAWRTLARSAPLSRLAVGHPEGVCLDSTGARTGYGRQKAGKGYLEPLGSLPCWKYPGGFKGGEVPLFNQIYAALGRIRSKSLIFVNKSAARNYRKTIWLTIGLCDQLAVKSVTN